MLPVIRRITLGDRKKGFTTLDGVVYKLNQEFDVYLVEKGKVVLFSPAMSIPMNKVSEELVEVKIFGQWKRAKPLMIPFLLHDLLGMNPKSCTCKRCAKPPIVQTVGL
jgi:hypothetical protein